MIHLNPHLALLAKTTMSIAVLGALYAQPYRLTRVVGQSMEPTYKNQSILWTLPAHEQDLHRGDVVVIHMNLDTVKGPIVKRIAFMPGDGIEQVRSGNHWFNLIEVHPRLDERKSKNLFRVMKVPPGMVYVMGDNRPVSQDSRTFGCIPIAWIDTKLVDQRPSMFNPKVYQEYND